MSMKDRGQQLILWIAATLAIALVVHYATLYAIPRRIMAITLTRMGAPNTMRFGDRPTAASRGVVRPSPDMLYAACRFDLSAGALRVTASVPHTTYWSMSAFDDATNNFFVRNDRQVTGGSFELVLMRHGQPMLPLDNIPDRSIVFAPSSRGLILIRTVIDDEKNLPALEGVLHQARCETVLSRP
jgi:uncharacterized membrane protein